MNKKKWDNDNLSEKSALEKRMWKREDNPTRILILWGWDNHRNPGLLFLYGKHRFDKKESTNQQNILEENVSYTHYVIVRGQEGHLPSFPNVKNIYSNLDKLHYTTISYDRWAYYGEKSKKYEVKGYQKLQKEITLPYFDRLPYEQCVEQIEQQLSLNDFCLVKHPNEILCLEGSLFSYYELIYSLMTKQNIYMRKKLLKQLIEQNPPKELYNLFLKIGSSELISGLFLELARQNNSLLIEEAQEIIAKPIHWVNENYAKGIKRCAVIYTTMFNKELKAERIKWIEENHSKIDLHLAFVDNKEIPEGEVFEGSYYQRYMDNGMFEEYIYIYNYKERKYDNKRIPERYRKSPYTEGRKLKKTVFKNTIQEADFYQLSEVIGRIAYYLDAPRLTYYFEGNTDKKALEYFKRYIKRVINSYAETDQEQFIKAIKAMCINYTENDYIGMFKGNFQHNELLKYYLYYEYKETDPYWRWSPIDNLMKIEGRYEYRGDIWDKHLKEVVEIAIKTGINPVRKACYFILNDHKEEHDFFETLSARELMLLTQSPYKPLSLMFTEFFKERLDTCSEFNPDFMLAMMESKNLDIHQLALDFMERTNGSFVPSTLIEILFFKNLDIWTSLFKYNLLNYKEAQYIIFVRLLLEQAEKFETQKIVWSEEIKDTFSLSAAKINELSLEGKVEFFSYLVEAFFAHPRIPDNIENYIEQVIFSVPYEELERVLERVEISFNNNIISQKNAQILSFLEAIEKRNLPSDAQIIAILETGTSQMVKTLLDMIINSDDILKERFSTLLIMMETDIQVLNTKAKEVFEHLPISQRQKLHMIFIDSPVVKVYQYALQKVDEFYLNKNEIPKEFLLHMLEHTSSEIKAYISNKINQLLDNCEKVNEELFLYYVKTLLLLPNKVSKSKDKIYKVIPYFVLSHKNSQQEIEQLLLDIGGSNNIIDSERALVTLAKIRKEALN